MPEKSNSFTQDWIMVARFRGIKILAFLLACLAFGLAELPAQTAHQGSQWEPAIRAFEQNDHLHPPPQNAVLFIGSSAIRKWSTLAKDFPGVPVINRGFGGSQISDSTAFASRIIFPYHPRVIVLYAGDNDLALGHKSTEQVVAEYAQFVSVVHARLPQARIVFISIKPSPSRWRLEDEIVQVNREIEAMKGPELAFVDVYSHMLGTDGHPQKDLFLADGLHPNEKGYALWASLIRPYLN
jgi:lysophospholipase L1-like esterase